MEKQKVAFLGPVASYTHQAALETFPAAQYDLVPQLEIADVFNAVQQGYTQRGVVPFENSSNGTVMPTLDRFADRERELQDVVVCGEAYVDVRHCIAGRLPKGLQLPAPAIRHESSESIDNIADGPTEEQLELFKKIAPSIRKVYSHSQAFGQCSRFLSTHLKGVQLKEESSTSRAAAIVAQENPADTSQLPDAYNEAIRAETVAIASETASRLYGLDILVSDVQNTSDNMTRFFIIRKQEDEYDIQTPIHERSNSSGSGGLLSMDPQHPVITSTTLDATTMGNPFTSPTFKTLISFTVPHTSPGALAKSLAVFAENGLNLTSINTRPSLIEPWNYLFFVEMLGRREDHGRGAVNAAMRALQGVARGSRWLGSWEMQVDTAEY